MKTVKHNGQTYNVAWENDSTIVVDLPENHCFGHISRMTINRPIAKPICYKDTELLSRLPVQRWFAAGSLGIHPSKLTRLCRLGVLVRRYAPLGFCRKWDYFRER